MSNTRLPGALRALLPAAAPTLVCPASSADATVVEVGTIFRGSRIVDDDAARACVAGVLLARDRFHDSHAVSQDLATAEGSYWHGILHRREPDAGNARYWMRRVGSHPIHAALAEAAGALGAGWLLERGAWNASRFVDACTGGVGDVECLVALQWREIESLLAWCAAKAIGAGD